MLYPFKLNLIFQATRYVKMGEKGKIVEKLGIKKKVEEKFLETIMWISERIEEFEDFSDFKSKLVKVLIKEFMIDKAISNLNEKKAPLNNYTLKVELEQLGVIVDENTIKFLLKTLKESNYIAIRQIPVWIKNSTDAAYEFILDKGALKFFQIQRHFSNARNLVLELAKQKRIIIEDIESIGIPIEEIKDYDRIDPNSVNQKSKFIEIYRETSSGKLYAMIVIPKNTTVKALW